MEMSGGLTAGNAAHYQEWGQSLMGWPTSGFGCGAKQKGVTVSSNPLKSGGEGEIRTPGTGKPYTAFRERHLKPLRHLSILT